VEVVPGSSVAPDFSTAILENVPLNHKAVVKKYDNPSNAFIEKSIHPPSGVDGYVGIPDFTQFPFVPVEFRTLTTCDPTGVALGPSGVTAPFIADNYLMLHTSGLKHPVIVFANNATFAPGTIGFVQDLRNTVLDTSWPFDTAWSREVEAVQGGASSMTTDLNMPKLTEKGNVTTAKYRPNIYYAGPAHAFREKHGKAAWKAFVKANMPYIKSLEEKFSVVHMTSCTDQKKNLYEDDLDFPPNIHIQIIQSTSVSGFVPTSPTEVLNYSRKAVNHPAELGTFVVENDLSLESEWVTQTDSDVAPDYLYICYYCTRHPDGALEFTTFVENTLPGVLASDLVPMSDTPWTTKTWSWTYYHGVYRGEVITDTISSPYATTAAPVIKTISCVRLCVSQRSVLAKHTVAPPMPNLRAIEDLAVYFAGQPDMKPSAANFLGALANVAKGIFSTGVLKSVGDKIVGSATNASKQIMGSAGQKFLGELFGVKTVSDPKQIEKMEAAKIADSAALIKAKFDVERADNAAAARLAQSQVQSLTARLARLENTVAIPHVPSANKKKRHRKPKK